MEEPNFVLLHKKEITFIPTDRNKRSTAIGLTLVTEKLIGKSNRKVLEHYLGATNHKTIITTIQENISPKKMEKNKQNQSIPIDRIIKHNRKHYE